MLNILAHLQSIYCANDRDSSILLDAATTALGEFRKNSSDIQSKSKIEFILEQIKLVQVAKNGRRYSSSLLVSCYSIINTSRAAYECLRDQQAYQVPKL